MTLMLTIQEIRLLKLQAEVEQSTNHNASSQALPVQSFAYNSYNSTLLEL